MKLKNINKDTYQRYTFKDIAQRISETVDPSKTDLEVYVGLEHIDGEDIHIRRKGVPADVKGGKLRCYPGDVIFGKRRAYQRKAAIVDFDGICSAHAFVFRANPEVIDPKLFPFFLHSDQFMNRMIDISVGGLSPTINWRDLQDQEFLLPPKEEQAELAELLWAMDEVVEKDREVGKRTEQKFHAILKEIFQTLKTEKTKLKDKIFLSTGKRMKGGGLTEGEILSIGGENIDDFGNLTLERKLFITKKFFDSMKNGIVKKGDILINKDGAKTGKVAILEIELEAAINEHVFIVREKGGVFLQRFLFYFFLSNYGQNQIKRLSKGLIGGVGIDDMNSLVIPLIDLKKQTSYVEKLDSIRNISKDIEEKLITDKDVLKGLIEEIF